MTRRLMSLGLCALQLLLIMPASAAPANTASQRVGGTINDALGRPVDRAELIIQTQDGHIIARARSDRSGHFEFAAIRPGTYAIVANKTGFATATSIVTVTTSGAKPVDISMEAQAALNMQVVAKRLDVARNGLSPETGSSVYRFSEKAIQELPQGTNTQMSNLLLQAPGVAQDSLWRPSHSRRARRDPVPDERYRTARRD